MHIENVIFLILSKIAYTKFSEGPVAPPCMYCIMQNFEMQIFYKLKVSNALRMIIRHFLFGKQKQPIVIQPKSIHVLIIKSGISASNTNGIKKLNNNKSTPNSTTPKRSGRINGFVANNLSFSHCNTNDKTNPTKTTQVVSRVMR